MRTKYIFYAEGGFGEGMGHLFRSRNLVKNLGITNETIFLYKNKYQKKFLKEHDLKNLDLYKYNPDKKNSLYLFDTKKDFSKDIDMLNLERERIISIDNFSDARKKCKFEVYPSFFHEDKFFKSSSKGIFSGHKFSILNQRLLKNISLNNKREKVIISFGGEDPNNLTLKVLSLIDDVNILKKVLVILGPNYKFPVEDLTKFISKKQIIRNPKNIYEIFSRGYCSITALGVTLQELLRLNTPIILVNNFETDLEDIKKIEKFCLKKVGNNFFFYIGSHKSINTSLLNKAIFLSESYSFKTNFNCEEMGSSWDLNKMFS